MKFLGIDLGGTTVKYSLVSQDGEVSHSSSFPTLSKNAEELLQKVVDVICKYRSDFDIQGVGISSAGVIHPYEGRVMAAGINMPYGWQKACIKEFLEINTHLPVVVDNDVNCAALGEQWLGAARDFHHFICIAMGTGIGAGIVINDRLYYGSAFQAGEVGYFHSNKGTTDFWEKKASTLALVTRVKQSLSACMFSPEEIQNIDGAWVFKHAETNQRVGFILEDWADSLASGIANMVLVLNPQAIILGGGVSAQGSVLIDLIHPRIQSFLPSEFSVELKTAQLGNDASKIGAVKRLMDELNSK